MNERNKKTVGSIAAVLAVVATFGGISYWLAAPKSTAPTAAKPAARGDWAKAAQSIALATVPPLPKSGGLPVPASVNLGRNPGDLPLASGGALPVEDRGIATGANLGRGESMSVTGLSSTIKAVRKAAVSVPLAGGGSTAQSAVPVPFTMVNGATASLPSPAQIRTPSGGTGYLVPASVVEVPRAIMALADGGHVESAIRVTAAIAAQTIPLAGISPSAEPPPPSVATIAIAPPSQSVAIPTVVTVSLSSEAASLLTDLSSNGRYPPRPDVASVHVAEASVGLATVRSHDELVAGLRPAVASVALPAGDTTGGIIIKLSENESSPPVPDIANMRAPAESPVAVDHRATIAPQANPNVGSLSTASIAAADRPVAVAVAAPVAPPIFLASVSSSNRLVAMPDIANARVTQEPVHAPIALATVRSGADSINPIEPATGAVEPTQPAYATATIGFAHEVTLDSTLVQMPPDQKMRPIDPTTLNLPVSPQDSLATTTVGAGTTTTVDVQVATIRTLAQTVSRAVLETNRVIVYLVFAGATPAAPPEPIWESDLYPTDPLVSILSFPGAENDLIDWLKSWKSTLLKGLGQDSQQWNKLEKLLEKTSLTCTQLYEIGHGIKYVEGMPGAAPFYHAAINKAEHEMQGHRPGDPHDLPVIHALAHMSVWYPMGDRVYPTLEKSFTLIRHYTLSNNGLCFRAAILLADSLYEMSRAGDNSKSRKAAEIFQAIESMPETQQWTKGTQSSIHWALACALYRSGQYAKAAQNFKAACALDGQTHSEWAWQYYVKALAQSGQVEEATLEGITSGTFAWQVTAGTDKVVLNGNSTTGSSITIVGPNTINLLSIGASAGSSLPTPDVTVNVTVNSVIVSHSLYVQTADHLALIPHVVGDDVAITGGFQSKIHYKIKDQFNQVLPATIPWNEDIDDNHAFTTGCVLTTKANVDFFNDWGWGDEDGWAVDPNDAFDTISRFPATACGGPICTTPTPANPSNPLGAWKIANLVGSWYVGSTTIAKGVRVKQNNKWQIYDDHGAHE